MNVRQLAQIAEVRRRLRNGEARALRQSVGVSLSEVAQVAGISVTAAWRYERGLRIPRASQALAYAKVLDRLEQETRK